MEWLWRWRGKCFGYREEDNLWTWDGRHVGRFCALEVYGQNGRYLGELQSGRLVRNLERLSSRQKKFAQEPNREPCEKPNDYEGFALYPGYEDFPDPTDL